VNSQFSVLVIEKGLNGKTYIKRRREDPISEQDASQTLRYLLRSSFRLAEMELGSVVVIYPNQHTSITPEGLAYRAKRKRERERRAETSSRKGRGKRTNRISWTSAWC
jgi:hypothetical protein